MRRLRQGSDNKTPIFNAPGIVPHSTSTFSISESILSAMTQFPVVAQYGPGTTLQGAASHQPASHQYFNEAQRYSVSLQPSHLEYFEKSLTSIQTLVTSPKRSLDGRNHALQEEQHPQLLPMPYTPTGQEQAFVSFDSYASPPMDSAYFLRQHPNGPASFHMDSYRLTQRSAIQLSAGQPQVRVTQTQGYSSATLGSLETSVKTLASLVLSPQDIEASLKHVFHETLDLQAERQSSMRKVWYLFPYTNTHTHKRCIRRDLSLF